jgi:hypothetical protein
LRLSEDLVDYEGVGWGLGEARETVAAGEPAAENLDVDRWNIGGEGHLPDEERRRWRGGGGAGAHEDLVAEHGECEGP